MDSDQVQSAFGILLEEVDRFVASLNENGAAAFQAKDYDGALRLTELGTQLAGFRDKIETLRKEWRALSRGKARVRRKPRRAERPKLARGLKTPQNAFRQPILEALIELGGRAPASDVLKLVGQKLASVLKDYDHDGLPSAPHEPRWRNTAKWCRKDLADRGLLKSGSPHGTWEITEKGRKALEKGEV